jgi:multicomponent Na+:H+ antiporter subunit D
VVTSLLTLYAIGRVWNLAFWRAPHVETPVAGAVMPGPMLPRLMVAATLALVVLSTGLTVVSGPLTDVTTRAATDLLGRQPYVRAVFAAETP